MQKIFVGIALLLQLSASAQSKIKFRSINQLGLLAGASSNEVQLHTINGISYKAFFAGIGAGFDNYYFKTVPLFLDLRKNIYNKKQTPFVYADIGINFPEDREKVESQWQRSKFNKGVYYDVGIGYQIPLAGKLSLNMSLGYSLKEMEEIRVYSVWGNPNDTFKEYYDYKFRRATIKLGLSF